MPRRRTHFLASHVGGITRFRPVFVGEVQGSDSTKPASRLNQYALFALSGMTAWRLELYLLFCKSEDKRQILWGTQTSRGA